MRTVFLVPLLLLAGCDAALGPIHGSTDPLALEYGTPWVAAEAVVDGERVTFPESGGYTMTVSDGHLGGRAAPNYYGAQRFAAFPDGSIEVDEIITTLAAGSAAQMRLGKALVTSLYTATRFEVTDEALALYGPEGDGIRFRR